MEPENGHRSLISGVQPLLISLVRGLGAPIPRVLHLVPEAEQLESWRGGSGGLIWSRIAERVERRPVEVRDIEWRLKMWNVVAIACGSQGPEHAGHGATLLFHSSRTFVPRCVLAYPFRRERHEVRCTPGPFMRWERLRLAVTNHPNVRYSLRHC